MAKEIKVVDPTDYDKLLKHFDDECQNYFNKIYPGLSRILEEGKLRFSSHLNFLYHLHLFQNYLLDDQEKYFKTDAAISISTFYSKAASDILCLYECLKQGQIISSMSIERNIFESFVNLKLILEKDTINRIKLYEDFAYVQQWNRIEEYQQYIKNVRSNNNLSEDEKNKEEDSFNKLFDSELIEITQHNYLKVKNNYLEGRSFNWAWKIFKDEVQKNRNPSLSFICNKLGIEKMYLQFYSLNSIVVHSQPLMTNMLTQNGGITPSPNFNDPIKHIAESSSMLVIEIILLVLSFAKSPKLKEIDDYMRVKWLRTF